MNLWHRLGVVRTSVRRGYHVVVNANQLIIDYVVICDKRGEVLDFADFIPDTAVQGSSRL